MQVELGTFRIDTGTRRLFPAYRPPRSLILALLYSMAMVFVYTLLFEIYCLVALGSGLPEAPLFRSQPNTRGVDVPPY
ncbi:hypothetical protein [Nocardia wallacei]|uniref:hypothetical protein n=1 Tax=Nocardia wallacei TaxID=480035 RepID=UPI0024549C42|nr:hypothetical protein [Nocardia wallacei]